MNQSTNTILMIRPVAMRVNEQTAVNNFYQKTPENNKANVLQAKVQQEFDNFVKIMRAAGIAVIVVEDTVSTDTPDAVFPNNWVSFHQDGSVVLYPMFAENRRLERRKDILDLLETKGFQITRIEDYTSEESENIFLEGTGSMVLDRVNKKAYCALSARSNALLFTKFCNDFGYTAVVFTARQTINGQRLPIYHTNVMMSVAEKFVVICPESIDDKTERQQVLAQLKADGKEIITITEAQTNHFAGNILQVRGSGDKRYLVMSEAAYGILTALQRQQLEKYGQILYSDLHTIECCGGGSARCMMAEVFLPNTVHPTKV